MTGLASSTSPPPSVATISLSKREGESGEREGLGAALPRGLIESGRVCQAGEDVAN